MRRLLLLVGFLASAGLIFSSPDVALAAKQYSIAVGTAAGTMTRLGSGMVEVVNRNSKDFKITTIPGGGRANPQRVGAGGADFGFTFSNFASLALRGKKPFKKAFPNLRGVVKLWDSVYHQYIGHEVYESGIHSWDDVVKSKKPLGLGVAKKGTSTEYISRTILGSYGLTYDDLRKRGFKLTFTGIGGSASAYQSHQLDIFFHNAGPPNAAGIRAALARPTTFMKMPEHLVKKLADYGFAPATIPANSYKGQTKPVHSIGTSGILLTTDKMDPDVVYTLLKITHENKKFLSGVHKIFKSLNPKTSWKGMAIPLHEGAKRFYKENGVKMN